MEKQFIFWKTIFFEILEEKNLDIIMSYKLMKKSDSLLLSAWAKRVSGSTEQAIEARSA